MATVTIPLPHAVSATTVSNMSCLIALETMGQLDCSDTSNSTVTRQFQLVRHRSEKNRYGDGVALATVIHSPHLTPSADSQSVHPESDGHDRPRRHFGYPTILVRRIRNRRRTSPTTAGALIF